MNELINLWKNDEINSELQSLKKEKSFYTFIDDDLRLKLLRKFGSERIRDLK